MAETYPGMGLQVYSNAAPKAKTAVDPVAPTTLNPNALTTTPTAASLFDQLLQVLAQGGTPEMQAASKARTEEIGRNREQQGRYSKEAAATDAQSLIQKAINDALRQAMPRIYAASEGAGASKSSLAALQTQEAATRGAIEGAAQAGQLSVGYGQVYNQLASVLENLTRQDPNSPSALLAQAIVGSKGIVTEPRIISSGTGSSAASERQVAPQQQMQQAQQKASPLDLKTLLDYDPLSYAPVTAKQAGTNPFMIIAEDPQELNYEEGIFEKPAYADSGLFDTNTEQALFNEDY